MFPANLCHIKTVSTYSSASPYQAAQGLCPRTETVMTERDMLCFWESLPIANDPKMQTPVYAFGITEKHLLASA